MDRYSQLARRALAGETITDGDDCFGPVVYIEEISDMPDGAIRSSLGCGNPVAVADLKEGDIVLDLGSGGGLDVLLSARRVGPAGKAYGLDASPDMLELARGNAAEARAANVEFLPGSIEEIPLPDAAVDVVISNCVINLSTDKRAVFAEVARVLRPGGRLGVTDVIVDEDLDPARRLVSEQAVGCMAGALTEADYREQLLEAGFTTFTLRRTHSVGEGLQSAIVHAATPTAPAGVRIRPMTQDDAAPVLRIYQAGLDAGDASFESTAPTWESFTAGRLARLRYVAVDSATQRVLGWIAASPVSERCVYAGVVEHSVYVDPAARGRNIGRTLLDAFIAGSELSGIWTIQTGIFPENSASLRLHEAAGFRVVGNRERLGRHNDRWRDVTFLERRSSVL